MNQNDKQRHERKQCEFRKIVCDECGEQVIWKSSRVHPCFMRKEMDELARKLNVVQNDMSDVQNDVGVVQNDMKNVQNDVRNVQNGLRVVKDEVKLTQEEMAYMTKEAIERYDLFTGRQKIFVCGGSDGKTCLNSVESYSWPENSWTLEPAMKEKRSVASAFVHGREIYVSGGQAGTKVLDSIESLNMDEENLEWMESPITMPTTCCAHKVVSNDNSAILSGGRLDQYNAVDAIYEISLNPPHTLKLLTKLPEPRCYHNCEIIDNQVIVAGGTKSSRSADAKNTVYAYDLNKNEFKTLSPLPFPIYGMATVSYKDNVILIGGGNHYAQTLNTVIMYNVKTGKVTMLPSLNHKRAGSAAVISGNVIIVMGGFYNETVKWMNSVEFFDFSSNVWRELSPMTTKRAYATAVKKPMS